MKKALTAVAAIAALAIVSLAAPSDANAQHRHRHHGGGIAPLLGGLAAGALIGGAIVSSQQPAYGYGPGYYAAPGPVYAVPAERYCEDYVYSRRMGDYVLRRFPC